MNDLLSPNVRMIGRYAVLRELRRDRSSVSYVAMDPVMHREVVVKAVQMPPPATNPQGSEAQISALEAAFVRQAQAAGKLHHPHIVTVFDAGRVHDVAYLAIERVAGRPLHELLAGGLRPEFVHCASITARVADAIEYAHSQGLAHGRLGPQHVILQGDGAPKVEGFGGWIDSGSGGQDALERTERLLPYFENEITDEARTNDVHAVAALLHMLLTGKAPQHDGDGAGYRPVSALRDGIPPALASCVDDTLSPQHPASRRAAGDLRDALTAFLWNERKSHVAPATIGIPLAAPPQPAPRLQPAAPSTVQVAPTTQRGAAPATPSNVETQATAADARSTAAELPATSSDPSLAEASNDLAQLFWRRTRIWFDSHRVAVGALGALVVIGVLIGVVLAQLAGRADRSVQMSVDVPRKAGAIAPDATGIVVLEISPWGEVFVDNKPVGVTPPLAELKLPIGRHLIEVRHGERPAIAAQVDVDAAKPLRIRHRFE